MKHSRDVPQVALYPWDAFSPQSSAALAQFRFDECRSWLSEKGLKRSAKPSEPSP